MTDDLLLQAQNCEMMAALSRHPPTIARLIWRAHELRRQIQLEKCLRACTDDEATSGK